MNSPENPDDDGIIRIKRLDPGHVDIVLDTHPGKQMFTPPAPPRPYGLILLCAVLAILSLCLLVSQLKRHADQLLPPPAKQAGAAPAAANNTMAQPSSPRG